MLVYDEFRAMNTAILLTGEGEQEALAPAFNKVRSFVVEAEARFSRFRDTSELSALNRASGTWFDVSAPMYEVLTEAAEAYRLTRGLFDPAILNSLEAVGYTHSMEEIRRRGSQPILDRVVSACGGFDQLETDPGRRAIWLPAGVRIDLGGIAKGWIAAQAAEILSEHCNAGAVSAGGDMVLFGLAPGEINWQISLEDPRNEENVLAVLAVNPGAVATSSVTRRQWKQKKTARHHIIDPRSGEPADSAWLSVTVWTEQAAHAEAFAKSLLIAGPESAWEVADSVDGLEFIAVDESGGLTGKIETMEVYDVPKQFV